MYYREVKSLRLIKNSHFTTLTFLFGAVLTDDCLIWGRFNKKIGAVLNWGRFRLGPILVATLFAHLGSSYLVRSGQSIPNPSEGGRLMFPCSVFFKLANVIEYDSFYPCIVSDHIKKIPWPY